jgi:hypothetical protein
LWERVGVTEDRGMDLVYIDESGDTGRLNSPTKEYLLIGIIVPEAKWHELSGRIRLARTRMRQNLGLRSDAEIHAAEFLGGAHTHLGLSAWNRVRAVRWLLKELTRQTGITYVAIHQAKEGQPEVLGAAWRKLLSQLDAGSGRRFLLLTDMTERKSVLRAIRGATSGRIDGKHPRRPEHLIEDPIHLDSRHAELLQIADVLAYLHRQKISPNGLFHEPQPRQLIRMACRLTRRCQP